MNIKRFGFSSSLAAWSPKEQFLSILNDIALLFPVFLIIFTWRGFFQSLVAKLMGDSTAQDDGFLTLNPLAHIDLIGLMIVIGVFFIIGGLLYGAIPRSLLLIFLIILGVRWTIPVPIDDNQFKNYRLGGILTSLSGSLASFILAFISLGIMRLSLCFSLPTYAILTILQIFQTLIDMSLMFGVLDLIPLPPFNGGRILKYSLPYSAQHIVNWLEEYSIFIFLILFFVPGISDIFFGGIFACTMIIKRIMALVFF